MKSARRGIGPAIGVLMLVSCSRAEVDRERPPRAAEAGPPPAASWRHAGWGGGGFYWCCAWHPTDGDVIYLGGDVAGVYKTEDKGKHWRFVNDGLVGYAVHSIAISRSDPETLYVMTKSGVCRSDDGGGSWQFLDETGKDKLDITIHRPLSVRAVAIDHTDPDVVYAGSRHGKIYKTVDGGKTWKKLKCLPKPGRSAAPAGSFSEKRAAKKESGVISYIVVARTNPRLVFAASTAFGLLRSQDAGATWTALDTPRSASSVALADENTLYASFWKDGIRKSTDGGKTWTAVGPGIKKGSKIREVAVHPRDPDVVYAVGSIKWNGAVYRSSDGGRTWVSGRTMKRDLDVNPTLPEEKAGGSKDLARISIRTNISINPSNPDEIFLSGNWRNCLSTDGGLTWEERSRKADITCVEDIQFCAGRTYVVAMDEGLLVSEDHGESWRQLAPLKYTPGISGHQWRVRVRKEGDTVKIVSTMDPWNGYSNRVLISEDSGKTFTTVTRGLPKTRGKVNCMWGRGIPRALAVDPNNPDVLYFGMDGDPEPKRGHVGGGVFKSVDGGYTWKQLPNQPGSRRMFFGLAVDPTDSGRVYWGACGKGGGLYRSEDGGGSWERVFERETWVFNVAVSPTGVVYCPGKNLWRSTDHGRTWAKITDFVERYTIVGIEIDPLDEKRIWISRVTWGEQAKGGVHRTTDGGATWEDITGVLPYRKPIVLRFNPETGDLWAGGVGLFKIEQ